MTKAYSRLSVFVGMAFACILIFLTASTPPTAGMGKIWVGGSNHRIYFDSGLRLYPNGGTNTYYTNLWAFLEASTGGMNTNHLTNLDLSAATPTNVVREPTTNIVQVFQTHSYSGTNVTLDFSSGRMVKITLTNNVKFLSPSAMRSGTYLVEIVQDSSGNRSATWTNTFQWPAGTAPTITTNANAKDWIAFVCSGTNMFGSASQNFQ